MHADLSNSRDSFDQQKIVVEGKMGVKTGAKKLFGDEVKEEDVYAFTDETQLSGREEKRARREKLEEGR